jgi:hypothetical protein
MAHGPRERRLFTLTAAHLTLLRQATALWTPVEAGSPAILISPKELDDLPAEEIEADIAARAGLAVGELETARRLVAELPEAFAQFLAHGTLAAGRYTYANPIVEFPFAAQALPPELTDLAGDEAVVFDLVDEHLALLRTARWRGLWMNSKRPYGDMTYFELDMARILDEPVLRNEDARLPVAQEQRLSKLHAETLPALQVYLYHAEVALGEYPHIAVEPFMFG